MGQFLVTGGAGFIGGWLTEMLLDAGHGVTVLDNLDPQVHGDSGDWPTFLLDRAKAGSLRLVEGDVTSSADIEYVLETSNTIDGVIHLAARVGVGQAEYEMAEYVRTNTMGTACLLSELENYVKWSDDRNGAGAQIPVFVAGSMSSYGEGAYRGGRLAASRRPGLRPAPMLDSGDWDYEDLKPIQVVEYDELQPGGIYAETKRQQEAIALAWGRSRPRFRVSVGRFFNVIGERQALSNPYTGVAAIFANAINAGERATIFEDGNQTRDFVHVNDVCRAVIAMVEAGSGVYNVCTGVPTSILSLYRLLAAEYGTDLEPNIPGKYRIGDVRHCVGNRFRLYDELGWGPRVDVAESIARLVAWSRAQDAHTGAQARATAELKRAGILR